MKMANNDIEDIFHHLGRIKSGCDRHWGKAYQIQELEKELRFLRTFLRHRHGKIFDYFLGEIKKKAKLIVEMLQSVFDGNTDDCKTNLNVERLRSHLLEFIEGNTSSRFNYELDDSYLSNSMAYLDMNLNDARSKIYDPILIEAIKILQKKMRFLRHLYDTEINGYVDHENLEYLETRIQFMANNVGHFCLSVWVALTDYTSSIDFQFSAWWHEPPKDFWSKPPNDFWRKPSYMLFLIVLVELEMKKIFLGELKASKFAQSNPFRDMNLPKGFSHHLQSLLVYLRNNKLGNFPDNVSAQNIDMAIEFLLFFLDADLSNHFIDGKRLNEVLENAGALVGDVLYVIQKLLPRSITKDDTSKINVCTTQISEKAKDLKAHVETYYKSLKFTASQFPTVGGLSFLDSLIRKLKEMSKSESGLVFMMKSDISNLVKELSPLSFILEKELSSLSSFFRDIEKVHHEHEVLKDLQRRTINLAYEADVAIDSILAHYNVFWHIFCSLPTILKEIKHICQEVTDMRFQNLSLNPCSVVEPPKHLPIQYSNLLNDEEVVGFEIVVDELIQYLTQSERELDVIPIVGMGGQGKTTCARKVYNDDKIISHFDVRAWCIISQTYNRRELLQEIFSQVTGSKDKVGEVGEVGELAGMLKQNLMRKRYLIVLDDMWDEMAWNDLRLSFPDDGNRSRIVVTTRLKKVGEHVKLRTDLYSLPFLTTDESCRLLQKKVFQQEDCPPQLYDVSVAVAKKCKGLPLVIVLVAGIIKKKKTEASWWEEVEKSLLSYLGESEEYGLSTMQLSYENLPDYLKPCLLYMGMFPEDKWIRVSKLISLWIAESFVQSIESGRLMEEVAEAYLMDLISSNLVMVSKRSYDGKVKYCQVHDVVLHFCLEKSRKEKFMLVVKGNSSQFQPFDWNESRVSFSSIGEFAFLGYDRSDFFTQIHWLYRSRREKFILAVKENPSRFQLSDWYESRVSFSSTDEFLSLGSKTRKPFHQHLRSLISTNYLVYASELRLVKVLDLSPGRVNSLSLASLNPLIHLKYLEVRTQFYFHPESHLPHLETLIVGGYEVVRLPAIFWKMGKLRHVEIFPRAEFDLEKNKQGIFEESSKLENLRILKSVRFQIDDAGSVDVLLGRRCPNLQVLNICFLGSDSEDDSVEICPKLESLTQLQKLNLHIGADRIVSELHLPSNLKKLVLTLVGVTLIESAFSFIAELPSLECLELNKLDFPSKKVWCLEDITFPKLKFLKLSGLKISWWDASKGSFPQLETLVIESCIELEEIPISFADILTLKQIKLDYCQKSLGASATKIRDTAEEIEGCYRINIIIEDAVDSEDDSAS